MPRLTICDRRPPTLQITLKFQSRFERFWELRKFKKQHKNVKILETGFTETGSNEICYWAEVKYEL